jgi:hypothetical protein
MTVVPVVNTNAATPRPGITQGACLLQVSIMVVKHLIILYASQCIWTSRDDEANESCVVSLIMQRGIGRL